MRNVHPFPGKQNSTKRKPKDRLPFLFYLMTIMFLVVGGRLVFIQAVKAEKFDRLAREQRLKSVELPPARGAVYDRNGEILAISVDMETIYATPYLVKKPRATARKLAPLLGEAEETIFEKLTVKSGFSYIKRKVDKRITKRLKRLELDGIGFAPESKRFYPGKKIAGQVLGFVGLDNVGLAGIELRYDKYLKGSPGKLTMEQDLYGRPIPGAQFKLQQPTNGNNLVLTLDKEIQYKAQVELNRAIKKWEASGGWIVVMNSKTGEIYAMAADPGYDPNKFYDVRPELFVNRAISDVYEPGSTMKIVTAAAALEERLYSPNTPFFLPGTIQVGGHTIHEAHERGAENFTFSQIVSRSSNVGAVTVGMALGKSRLYEYIKRFGLNEPTGVELMGEGQGYVPVPEQWSASTIGNVPFGQGLSATALEMIRAVNVVAGGGRLIQPTIVKTAIDSKGRVGTVPAKANVPAGRAISAATAATMGRILKEAVENGTGEGAKIPGYEVAGKTGTAQKAKVGERGYDPGKYISSFVGFTPVSDPALTILVAIDEPKGAIYGGVVAAPAFSSVGEFALRQLKIKP